MPDCIDHVWTQIGTASLWRFPKEPPGRRNWEFSASQECYQSLQNFLLLHLRSGKLGQITFQLAEPSTSIARQTSDSGEFVSARKWTFTKRETNVDEDHWQWTGDDEHPILEIGWSVAEHMMVQTIHILGNSAGGMSLLGPSDEATWSISPASRGLGFWSLAPDPTA